MKLILGLHRVICTLNQWVGNFIAWVAALLVCVVFVDVCMRYIFNTSFVFTQELEWHLFGFIFLIGAGYTLLHDGHVRVDVIYQRVSPKTKAWINFIGVIFFLIPGCFLVIQTSAKFALNSWNMMEGSPDPGGIPFRFIIKGAIPVGFTLMFLQGIALGIESLFTIIGIDIKAIQKESSS